MTKEPSLTVGQGGWVLFQDPDLPKLRIWAKVNHLGKRDRLKVEALLIQSPNFDTQPLDGPLLRAVKVGTIEALANSPAYYETILERGRVAVDLTLRVRADDSEMETVRVRASRPPRFEVPSTRPYPTEFFKKVASLYGYYQTSGRPAAEVADELGVSLSAVHAWLQRARSLGFLTEGRKD